MLCNLFNKKPSQVGFENLYVPRIENVTCLHEALWHGAQHAYIKLMLLYLVIVNLIG
jgi:hypothetical protein